MSQKLNMPLKITNSEGMRGLLPADEGMGAPGKGGGKLPVDVLAGRPGIAPGRDTGAPVPGRDTGMAPVTLPER